MKTANQIKTANIVMAVGAFIFVGSVWEWEGIKAAWEVGGFCALLLGLMLSIKSTLEDLQRALKGQGE